MAGADAIKRRLRVIVRNVHREVVVAMDEAAEDLRDRATSLAPQLEGELILSAEVARQDRRDLIRRVVFFDKPYAVVRHEDFYNLGPISSLKRSPEGPIGRKYLSRPFQAHNPRYQREVGTAIDRGIRLSVR